MIAALEPFQMFRAYVYDGDKEARDVVERAIVDTIQGERDGRTAA